ncbi:MAG TPA: prolyl oligopeptidase family serine peptidase [Arenimonas sp.]|nr:prolyl oligopeptidase family serine peptidase [Arenimonas sp.]
MNKIAKLFLILALLLVATSAMAGVREVKPGHPLTLSPGEGMLLLVFDSNVPIDSAGVVREGGSGSYFITRPPAAKTIRLLVAQEGNYSWTDLQLYGGYFQVKKDGKYRFKVSAGVVNYPGNLVFELTSSKRASISKVNHSLEFMDWLAKTYPDIEKSYPFEYTGDYPDPFPSFYRSESAGYKEPRESRSRELPPVPAMDLSPELLWKTGRIISIQLSPDASYVTEIINLGEKKQELNVIDLKSGTITQYSEFEDFYDLTWVSNNAFVLSVSGLARYVQVKDSNSGKLVFETTVIARSGNVLDPMLANPDYFLYATWATLKDNAVYIYKLSKANTASLEKLGNFTTRNRVNINLKNDRDWITDAAGNIAAATVFENGKRSLYMRSGAQYLKVRELPDINDEFFYPVALSSDGKKLFAITDENRPQRELVKMDLATGANVETVFSKDGIDISYVIFDAERQPIGVAYYLNGQARNEYFDQNSEILNRQLAKVFSNSNISSIDRDQTNSSVLIYVNSSSNPGAVYLFDTRKKQVEKIDDEAPWLEKFQFSDSLVLKTTAKDGLVIESYLTLPVKKQNTPFPLVVMPHGGPIGIRDARHFDSDVQFLVSQGYAVLQVNFRGSSGYGKAFREAGKGSFGTAIENDIDASLNNALANYPLDKSNMCIIGMSYGGYSALVSAMRWPDRYKCAISFSGISDRILSFTASDSVRLESTRKWMEDYFGNPLTSLDKMKSEQPLYAYKKLKTPLMLIHGTDDVRVDYEHATRLQRMLTMAGNPPVMLTLKNEGHGFTNIYSIKVSWENIAGFLAQHLKPVALPAAVPAKAPASAAETIKTP